jgi:TetR/AcrR family transcriptional regulator, regulator of autoinduction and epiphytic fitness
MKPITDDSLGTDPKKAETILDGATQEFMAHGYAATSMNQIAIAAKVSKPTLYTYFQDKAGLFVALIERFAHRQQMLSWLQDPQTLAEEPTVVLHRLATEILDQFAGEQLSFFMIRTIIGESARFPALARAFVIKTEQQNIQVLSQFLAAHPQVDVADPEIAARVFMGTLVHHIITQKILHGQEVIEIDRERLITGLVALIVSSPQQS